MATKQTQVVVIGAGYAGLLATVRLAGKLRHQPVTIKLVNASDTLVERVRLHQRAAGLKIKQRSIPNLLRGTGVEFVRGYVSRLDAPKRTVSVQTDNGLQQINYDYLLYALGSVTGTDSVPGVRDYAYTLAPEGPLSAAELHERLLALNETGGKMVVCGGGPTGIESAAEFAGTFPKIEVHLVTRGTFEQIWARGGEGVAHYVRRSLNRRGITIQERTTITEVRRHEIETDAGTIQTDLTLWTGGFVPPPIAREAGLAVNASGQILVDPFLRSISHPEIMAVGDAAYPVEEPGAPHRMSAFTAVVMGAHGADCLSAILRDRTPRPLSYAYAGQGVALGPHDAIGFNNYPNDTPHRPYFTGRLGYAVRDFFVRYLANVISFERRWPGLFFWLGKGRYAASKRHVQQHAQETQTGV